MFPVLILILTLILKGVCFETNENHYLYVVNNNLTELLKSPSGQNITRLYMNKLNLTEKNDDINRVFEKFNQIKDLSLSYNKLKSLNNHNLKFIYLSEVEFISLDHNLIESIEDTVFKNNKKLINLDLSFNLLKTVNLVFIGKPQLIYLFGNKGVVPQNLNGIVVVKESLFCFYNETKIIYSNAALNFDFVYDNNYIRLKNLSELISFSKINPLVNAYFYNLSLNESHYVILNKIFKKTQLETLDLSFNKFKSLNNIYFSLLGALKVVLLNNNELETVKSDTFVKNTKLLFIDLSFNKFKSFNLNVVGLNSLEVILLNGNGYFEIELPCKCGVFEKSVVFETGFPVNYSECEVVPNTTIKVFTTTTSSTTTSVSTKTINIIHNNDSDKTSKSNSKIYVAIIIVLSIVLIILLVFIGYKKFFYKRWNGRTYDNTYIQNLNPTPDPVQTTQLLEQEIELNETEPTTQSQLLKEENLLLENTLQPAQ